MFRVSVVVPARNEGANLIDTVRCVLDNSEWSDLEVIVVDDGSTDGSPGRVAALRSGGRVRVLHEQGLGVARARNHGAAMATGEVVVFLDGHCYVPPGWLPPLVDALSAPDTGLVGPAFTNIRNPQMRACGVTWQDAGLDNVWLPPGSGVEPVPFHIGACQAVRADIFKEAGGYDCGMVEWGSEDIELCLRLWLLGYQVLAQPASLVYHLFRTSRPYAVNTDKIVDNRLRLAYLHFEGARLARALKPMLGYAGVERCLARMLDGNLAECRRSLYARRRHDMDWFCTHFKLEI